MRHRLLIPLLTVLLGATVSAGARPDPQLIPDWRHVGYPPLEISEIFGNPVLDLFDVTDVDAGFVADPFLFHEGGLWHMFFEVKPYGLDGVIAVAKSENGRNWVYDRVVLEEPFHLSYPYVFKWDGCYYMAPDIYPDEVVRLYRATEEGFPYRWEPVADILTGRLFADSSLIRFRDRWWIFTSDTSAHRLWVYYSDNLTDPDAWIEHPLSPVKTGDPSGIRGGGRPLVLADDRILRFAQDCEEAYGLQVRVFEVDCLTPFEYGEHELPESPLLGPSGGGWNRYKMHHIDAWWTGDRWRCVTDGKLFRWAIGIYESPAWEVGIEETPTALRSLICHPNPFNPTTTLNFTLERAGSVRLTIHDLAGREIAVVHDGPLTAGEQTIDWRAENLPSGLYFARLATAAGSKQCKLMLLK